MKLGQVEELLNQNIGKRDAFHVACVLCEWDESGAPPTPGMRVRFTGDAFSSVRQVQGDECAHGVIDPFLTNNPPVYEAMFWVLLMPGLASAPRHDFEMQIAIDEGMAKGEWDCRDCSE